MEAEHVINIAATICPPENDEEFNRWYDEKHIPINMKFKGLIGVTRYRLLRSSDYAIIKEHPQYLTTYEFEDMETFKQWNISPELAAASEGVAELFARLGVGLLWRVQYKCVRTWKNTPPFSVISILGIQCPPETEDSFDKWYSEKHIPDLLKFKGLEGVARYKLASSSFLAVRLTGTMGVKVKEYPKSLVFYYFRDLPTFEAYDISPERMATLDEASSIRKETGCASLWWAQYEPMQTWRR